MALYTQIKPSPVKTGDRVIDKAFDDVRRAFDQLYKLLNVNGNKLIIDGNIKCKTLTVDSNSIYIGNTKLSEPSSSEDNYLMYYDRTSGEIKFISQGATSITSHSSLHENGGSDEINLSGLSGTPADLTSHIADTTTHGTVGDIVGTSDSQEITNKKFGGAVNYSEFEADGTYVAHGDAIVYDDQQVNMGDIATSGWFGGNEYCDIVEYRSGVAIEFQNSTIDNYSIRFNAQITHKYAEGEDIEFHIHVGCNSATSGNVVFKLTYQWANMEDTYGASSSTQATVTIDGTDGKHQMEEIIATISGTGKEISSILLCTLERLAGDASDTFSESVYVIGIDFHVPMNTLGSRTEGSK